MLELPFVKLNGPTIWLNTFIWDYLHRQHKKQNNSELLV